MYGESATEFCECPNSVRAHKMNPPMNFFLAGPTKTGVKHSRTYYLPCRPCRVHIEAVSVKPKDVLNRPVINAWWTDMHMSTCNRPGVCRRDVPRPTSLAVNDLEKNLTQRKFVTLFIYLLCHIYPGVPHQCTALFSLGLLHYMHDKTNINPHTFSYNTVTTLTTWYIHHYMHNVNYLYMFLITVVTCRCRYMIGQHYVQCI